MAAVETASAAIRYLDMIHSICFFPACSSHRRGGAKAPRCIAAN
jgi:hypothetical protein